MGGVTLQDRVFELIGQGISTNRTLAQNLGVHTRQAEHATRTLADLGLIARPRENIGKRVAVWVLVPGVDDVDFGLVPVRWITQKELRELYSPNNNTTVKGEP